MGANVVKGAPKILAAVITHNRCELLSRCLDHVFSQKRVPDGLIVINNGSTDDTVRMLEVRGVARIDQCNLGSAGGWARAIKYGLTERYNAIWLMDDDGYPDSDALDLLAMRLDDGISCVSSVVVKEDNCEELVFPIPVLDKRKLPAIIAFPRKLATRSKLEHKAIDGLYPFAHFFNGALINLLAIENVGNVDPRFFMFGEEVDLFFRLRKFGPVYSDVRAIHYHPDVSKRPYTPEKIYYFVKNSLILNKEYLNWVFLRNSLTIFIAIVRTLRRNGVALVIKLVLGGERALLYRAILRGLRGQIGKDLEIG